MLHQPAHATVNHSAHAVDGAGKVYFNDFERLVKERLARRHVPPPGQAAQQHSARPPLADQKNPASDNYALFGVQESRSLLGKRKAADVHTDDHDHEHPHEGASSSCRRTCVGSRSCRTGRSHIFSYAYSDSRCPSLRVCAAKREKGDSSIAPVTGRRPTHASAAATAFNPGKRHLCLGHR